MDAIINITRGMECKPKPVAYSVDSALHVLNTRTDSFEMLNMDKPNRLYLDIDGKNVGTNLSREDFFALDTQTREVIKNYFSGEEYSLLTSTSFDFKTISYRLVLKNKAVKTLAENKAWARLLQNEMEFPEGISIDLNPYMKNQKIRMLNANKDGQNRPMKLVHGEPQDTFISLADHCEVLQLKTEDKKPRGRPPKVKESKLLNVYERISMELLDNRESWIKLGIAMFNEGESIDVFKKISSKSDKYDERGCDTAWKSFKLGKYNIWSFLKEHDADLYSQLKQHDYEFAKAEFEKTTSVC